MLALLVPGVGMGGGGAAAAPTPTEALGHSMGRRITNVRPYLTVLLALLLAGMARG